VYDTLAACIAQPLPRRCSTCGRGEERKGRRVKSKPPGERAAAGKLTVNRRRRTSKASVALAVDLVDHIVANDLPEGTALPHEKEMADTFELGRSTIREALRVLETRGVVQIRSGPGGGPVVRKPEPRDFSSSLELTLAFEGATLRDIFRAREDIGAVAAQLAAVRATKQQIRDLESIYQALVDNLDSDAAFAVNGRLFEGMIGQAAGSTVLRIVLDGLGELLEDAVPTDSPQRRTVVAEHLAGILDAIRKRNSVLATEKMSAYLLSGAEYWRGRQPGLDDRPIRWRG
jgi:GntR family transcriptional regulator, transcriptional repressor for pyruvate dehydrogenase complex